MTLPKLKEKVVKKRRAKGLSFFFCAIFTINCLFCTSELFGQTCPIRLNVTTVPARCQTDGEIHCTLSDTSAAQLSQIRYYYIPYSGVDSITESSRASITHLRPGMYKVRVTALCATGLHQGDAYAVVSDSVENVVVESQYIRPTNGIVYNMFTFAHPYGIVPSLTCHPTGKVQLHIVDGTFPYSVDVWKVNGLDTVFIRNVLFDNHQNEGTDSLKFDFKNYYTIDSLEAGDYVMLCHDACGYYMPRLTVTIPTIRHNLSRNKHLLRNSSGFFRSNNILTFKEVFDYGELDGHNDDYYHYMSKTQSFYEYRFVNPDIRSGADTTQWYPMPLSRNGMAFIYDTVAQATSYGDMWFKEVLLQIRPAMCEDTVMSFPFTIYPQGLNTHHITGKRINESTGSYFDGCWQHSGVLKWYYTVKAVSAYHQEDVRTMNLDSLNYPTSLAYTLSEGISNALTGMSYHNYITLPIKYKLLNVTADTLICSGEADDYYMDYSWTCSMKVDSTIEGDTILVEITDNNDCPLYAAMSVVAVSKGIHQNDVVTFINWKPWQKDFEEYCPDGRYGVGVYQPLGDNFEVKNENGDWTYMYLGDTVQLIDSPLGDFYNFTAVADGWEHFDVVKENPENNADIQFTYYEFGEMLYPGMIMSDRGLPQGRYVWVISYPCDHKNDTMFYDLQYEVPVLTEKPAYQFDAQCTRLEILPTAGKLVWKGKELQTLFQVYLGDSLIHSSNAVRKGEPLYIGVAGDYTLSMYALPNDDVRLLPGNPCFRVDTVVHWDGATLVFDYFYSYVCNEEDTVGFVRTKAKGGLQPYTYRLYAQPDGQGPVMAQNSTGAFDDVPIRFMQAISIDMEDACGAHFLSNFTVSDLNSIRKCWVEDGLGIPAYEEGDTCHFHGLAWHDFTYHWRGPELFEDSVKDVNMLLSLNNAGWYYIEVEGSACGLLQDSLLIEVIDPWANVPCPEAVDYDGNVYASVRIDRYCWTQRNLVSEHYSDGRDIPDIMAYTSDIYPDVAYNVSIFGLLYTWMSAMDSLRMDSVLVSGHHQGICPQGWYLPDVDQYETLSLHGASALRSPLYWINESGGTNETMFSALPAGFYHGIHKRYENLLGETRFWSTFIDKNSENQYFFKMIFPCSRLEVDESCRNFGYSIRCILEE